SGQPFRGYPVVDAGGRLLGIVTRGELNQWLKADPAGSKRLSDLFDRPPVVAYPRESCRNAAIQAAVEKLDRIPIVDPDTRKLLGMVTRYDLLKPYTHYYHEEKARERIFHGGHH
ncbi:MAG TPA: CBS domain-containing protein, partial [Gammaproteobacteria bacterium]|nr:CBS domain-containing protein [Gammaproteobacteria bacterium]